MAVEFQAWPKIPRLNREVIVTEKVDGTNAAIQIPEDDSGLFAQSRKRLITPGDDNYGFARWVAENAVVLKDVLGYGIHFGEWYGEGIQKNPLGITGKRFMLFNVTRWAETFQDPESFAKLRSIGIDLATVVYQGAFNTDAINNAVAELRDGGSQHVPGGKAEGVIVYHTAANQLFKVLCENDEGRKG
jgi:hypothetical protein